MYIYNVTVSVDPDIAGEWLVWMKETHIPEVLATGMFTGYSMLRVLNTEPDEGLTYSVQYRYQYPEDYSRYREEFAPGLQQKAADLFGGKFVAFRTLLETIA